MIRRSRIAYPTVHSVDVIRRTKDRVNGRFVETGDTTLYSRIAANIRDVKRFDADQLGKPSGAGMVAENQYQVGLGGFSIPNRILRGDYIRVYWGTYPNLYSPPQVPRNYSLQLVLNDGADHLLTWNQNGWYPADITESYSIIFSTNEYGGSWALYFSGEFEEELGTEFDLPKIDCMLPDGVRLVRLTAPPMDLKVIQVNHKDDDRGRWHHTAVLAEYSDTDSGVKL